MKLLDKEQRLTLRKLFNSNLRKIVSMPLKHHGIIMSQFDRALSEMDRLAAQTPTHRSTARKCAICRIPAIRGVYSNGTKHWMCIECAESRGLAAGGKATRHIEEQNHDPLLL